MPTTLVPGERIAAMLYFPNFPIRTLWSFPPTAIESWQKFLDGYHYGRWCEGLTRHSTRISVYGPSPWAKGLERNDTIPVASVYPASVNGAW